jgi:hypothetical protein
LNLFIDIKMTNIRRNREGFLAAAAGTIVILIIR